MKVVGSSRTMWVIVFNVALSALVAASVLAASRPDESGPDIPLSIAVVGDDYSAGVQNRSVWPTLMAQRTGWSVANFAQPNAGFVADGQGGHAFTYQVDRAKGANTRVILIVGGLNDTGLSSPDPVGIGAIDAINKITLGGRRALVVGPTWFERPIPESVVDVAEAVRQVAEDAGVPYLDALEPPLLTRAQMQPDLSGPTDAGQSVLADRITEWVRSEVAR